MKVFSFKKAAIALSLGLGLVSSYAMADEATNNQILFKARINGALPQQKMKVSGTPNFTVQKKQLKNALGAEVSGTYFFDKNIAAELGFGYSSFGVNKKFKQDIKSSGKSVKRNNFFSTIATAQYHLDEINGFKPYVGAGYAFFKRIGGKHKSFHGPVLQAGLDYMISDKVGINADIKKVIAAKTLRKDSGAGYQTKYKLSPLVIGAGVTFRL